MLTTCPACSKRVSDRAPACPFCQTPASVRAVSALPPALSVELGLSESAPPAALRMNGSWNEPPPAGDAAAPPVSELPPALPGELGLSASAPPAAQRTNGPGDNGAAAGAAPPAAGRTRRLLVSLAVCGLACAVAAPVALWLRYRHGHVLSRNALVRGHIADVGTQLKGVVADMTVDAGDRVHAGQVMARLEDRQLVAEVRRAQSELEKAISELRVERLAINQERRSLQSLVTEASRRIAEAEAEVQAADSRAVDAKERYELRASLEEEGVVSREVAREARAHRRTAEALLLMAKAKQEAAEAAQHSARVEYQGLTVREERVTVLESRIGALRAELALAEADVEAAKIRAPGNGWVVRRIAEPGTSLDYGQPVISVWLGDRVWVEAWIDEGDVSYVGIGSPATVTLKPYPDRVFSGVVESIGMSTDYEVPQSEVPQPRYERMRSSPVVPVRVGLDDPGEGLVPGLSAEVGIRKNAQGLASSALAHREPSGTNVTESR